MKVTILTIWETLCKCLCATGTNHILAGSKEKIILDHENMDKRNKHIICPFKSYLLFMRLFLHCALSCASSSPQTVCRSKDIAYMPKVFHCCELACVT